MLNDTASAQGRSGGAGGGRGAGNPGAGPPSNPGIDFGLGRASERSGGRSDVGLERAGNASGGRSDEGMNRARAANENRRQAEREMQKRPEIAEMLGMNRDDLSLQYQAALANNPNLKFGQFVAANVLADNLSTRNPNITTTAILGGLAEGKSIGRVLQDFGISSSEGREAVRNAENKIKQNKKRQ
jgi:hypothetical protein